jgi:hypothetical protein
MSAKILPFPLHTSPLSVQALQSRSCLSYLSYATMGAKSFKVKVKVMLRPTVSRPACLGVKPHLGPKIRVLLLSDSFGFVDVERPR